ncbi:MAG TPA: rod shape-determining protein [Candidatus Atribacteria bacterium]|nr:rod shape-determining protein [Candidatus Atribacteria bacterium]
MGLPIFKKRIGIDLGTAYTLVYVKGKGIVLNEPSVISVYKNSNRVVDVGRGAKKMIGRAPYYIDVIRPLRYGVISELSYAVLMLKEFLERADVKPGFFSSLETIVCVPSAVSTVDKKAVLDLSYELGSRKAFLIAEPIAAAIGAGMEIFEAIGSFIMDIGGGTSESAIISLGGLVVNEITSVAGDRMNEEIIRFFKSEYKILIGEQMAESIKINLGIVENPTEKFFAKGRDLVTGLPKGIEISASEIRVALLPLVDEIVRVLKETLVKANPEILSDISERGLVLSGGGSLIKGLDTYIRDKLEIPVIFAPDPLFSVINGIATVFKDLSKYLSVLTQMES